MRNLDAALASECDKVLFSCELILRNGVARRYAELNAFLDERGADVVFVLFDRNVADHAFSQWGQQLKAGRGTADRDHALQRYRAPSLSHLRTVEDACGRAAIIILNYDSLELEPLADTDNAIAVKVAELLLDRLARGAAECERVVY